VGSFVIGLPFGVKGVALCYCLVLVTILPWVFRFTFQGTNLTLKRFGGALLYPISMCLGAVFVAACSIHVIAPEGNLLLILVGAMGYAVVYSFSLLLPTVREEIRSLIVLYKELRIGQKTE
jgi:hypothetical protein